MNYLYRYAKVILFCIFWLAGFNGLAQVRYWVGGSGSWNDSQHWSYTSGGKGGATVPSINEVAVFNQHSFAADGQVLLSNDIEVGGFVWDKAASGSSLSGDYTIKSNGAFSYGSLGSWNGSVILNASKTSYVDFPSATIGYDVLFTPTASYIFGSNVTSSEKIEVQGDDVNFAGYKVKAKPLIASSAVKSTAGSTGFFKSTQSDGGLTIEYSVVNVTCPGGSNGSITITKVTATGLTNPLSYEWLDVNSNVITGQTTSTLSNIPQGFYYAKVSDSSKPKKVALIKIGVQDPAPISLYDFNVTDATCNGSATGQISASPIGGTKPYYYSKDGVTFSTTASEQVSITGLAAGSYTFALKDQNGCLYTYPGNPVIISQPAVISLSLTKSDVTTCFGNNNGTVTATATGGTPPLEYSIDGVNFVSTSTFPTLAAGPHTLTVRSSVDHTCSASQTVTISQPTKMSATAVANPVSGCSATPDGQIVISGAVGGSGAYEYSVDGGASWSSLSTFTGLGAKSYNVVIRDKNNPTCMVTINADLQVAAATLLSANYTSTNVNCNGSANGTITITNPQGGSGAYEYNVTGTWTTNTSFTSLSPNTYTLQIRDKNTPSCFRTFGTVTITEPAVLSATVSKVNVTGCSSSSNGSIAFTNMSGGSGTYEYSIGTTWSSTATFSGLPAGTYPVSIRDKVNTACVKPLGTQVITAPTALSATFTKVDVTGCSGNANGSITFVSPTGGSGQYEFSTDGGATWSSPAGNTFTGLTAKSYTLIIRDKASPTCTSPVGVANIIEPTPLTATVTPTAVACHGSSTGSLTISGAAGGSGTFEFTINNGTSWTNVTTFPNLNAGSYTVIMRDAVNKTCTKNLGSYTVTQPTALTATVTPANISGCHGDATGSIAVTAAAGGAGGPYEYSRNNLTWSSTSTFTGLAAGTYPIYIREKATPACSVKLGDYTLTEPSAVSITSAVGVDPNCFGENSGKITVTATGGTPPLMYSDGGLFQTGSQFTGLGANTYVIVVQDAANCKDQKNVTLNNPAKLVPTISKVDIGCTSATGQITVNSVAGGTAPYQYSIFSGTPGTYQTPNTFTGLAATTYNVKVKDVNLCESDIVPTTIATNTMLNVSVASVTDVKPCKGDHTGSIVLKIATGTAPYTYNIGAGDVNLPANSTISNVAAGTYSIVIKDGAGCSISLTNVVVGEPAQALTATFTKADVTACPDNGSIVVTVAGGVAPYSFSKDNGATYSTPAAATTYTFGSLGAASYHVIAKDNNGCTIDLGSITIVAPAKLTLTATPTNVLCNGDSNGSIATSATGGTAPYTFSINPGTQLTNLAAGTYTVMVRDAGGCTDTKSVQITQPTAIQDNVQSFDVTCHGKGDGKILVAPTGGTPAYVVTLNPTATFASGAFSNLTPGSYTVNIRDVNGCAATKNVTIAEPASIVIASQAFANPTCAVSGSITVTATGGTAPLTYTLVQGVTKIATNATGAFTGVASGTYTVEVTDVNSCTKAATSSITLNSPSTITFTNITAPAIGCNGGLSSLSVTVKGVVGTPTITVAGPAGAVTPTVSKVGADYTVTAANQPGGSYSVKVVDSNDPTCSQTQTITISEPAKLVLGTPTIAHPTAGNNGSITIVAAGGTPTLTYKLMNGATTVATNTTGIFSGLGVGTYSVTVTDANGCTDTKSNIVLASLAANLTPKDITCFGLNNGQITVEILGGSAPYTITVTSTGTPVAPIATSNTTSLIPNLGAGSYSVVVTDNNGVATTQQTVTIHEPNKLGLVLSNAPAMLCAGVATGSIDVAISGGTTPYTTTWTGDNGLNGTVAGATGTMSNLSSGKYTVTTTDVNGCTVSATQTIAGNPAIAVTVTAVSPTCGNATSGSITLVATGGTTPPAYTYSIDNGTQYGNSNSFTGKAAGNYVAIVKDGVGCTSTPQNVVLNASSNITITEPVQKTDAMCALGGTITAVAAGGSNPLTYKLLRSGSNTLISTNTTGVFIDVPQGKYIVSVSDGGTCSVTSSVITINHTGTATISEVNRKIDNILCHGGTGTFTINIKGVVGNIGYDIVDRTTGTTLQKGVDYTYSPTPGANAGEYKLVFDKIKTGSYNLFVWDDNACPQKFPFSMSEPTALKVDNIAKTDPKSKTSMDGTVTVTVSGGTPTYTYHLYDKSDTQIDFNTDGKFTGLGEGTYYVMVYDDNNCQVVSTTVDLVAQSNLTIDDIIVTNPKCHGETNGSIDIYASGGSGKMQYSRDNGKTFQDEQLFSGLSAGTYDIVVMDAVGATATQKVTLVDPDAIVLTLVNFKIPTASNDGVITVIASGGSGLYTISLVDNKTGLELLNTLAPSVEVTFDKLPSSSFKVVATDENGCTAIIDPVVLERLTATVTTTDIVCGNSNDGKIDVAVSGGVAPYKITWQPEGDAANGPIDMTGTTYSISNLPAKKYTITVNDASGATVTKVVTIKSKFTPIVAKITSMTDSICVGTNSGSINLSITGGNPAYTITWTAKTPDPNGNEGTVAANVISGLHASAYTINIADGSGCSAKIDTAIYSFPAISIDSVKSTNVKCNGSATGTIHVYAKGGVGALSYSTTIGGAPVTNNTGLFNNVPSGTYTVAVTDVKGCTIQKTDVTITEPEALKLNVVDVQNESCSGPGQITVKASGGSGFIDYNINTTTNRTGIFTGLTAGDYTVTATDSVGCSVSLQQKIISTATLKIDNLVSTDVKCHGSSTGTVQFGVSGATSGLVVTINGTTVEPDAATGLYSANNLPVGDATIIAKDDSGCTVTNTITLSEPEALSVQTWVTAVPQNTSDNTGTIDVIAKGGVEDYDINIYRLSDMVKLMGTTSPSVKVTFDKLKRGKYVVVILDKNGCTVSDTVNIDEIKVTAKGLGGNCKDPNGSIEVDIVDGAQFYNISYTKKGDATVIDKVNTDLTKHVFTNVPPGDYTVTVVDNSNFTKVVDVTVPVYTAPTVKVKSKCFVDGKYYIQLDLPDGFKKYTVECKDPSGNEYKNYDYVHRRIMDLVADLKYSIIVTDSLGCPSDVLEVDLAKMDELKSSVTKVEDVSCHGMKEGKVQMSATGGVAPYSYYAVAVGTTDKSSVSTDGWIQFLAAGSYAVYAEDANGCFGVDTVDVKEPATGITAKVDLDSSKLHLWCSTIPEGRLDLLISGGVPDYTVNIVKGLNIIDTGTPVAEKDYYRMSFTKIPDGAFTYEVIDKNGCKVDKDTAATGNHLKANLKVLRDSWCEYFTNPDDLKTKGGAVTISDIKADNYSATTVYSYHPTPAVGNVISEFPIDNEGYYKLVAPRVDTIDQLNGVMIKFALRAYDYDPDKKMDRVCEDVDSIKVSIEPANDFHATALPDGKYCINSDVLVEGFIGVGTGVAADAEFWVSWTNLDNPVVHLRTFDNIKDADFKQKFDQLITLNKSVLSTKNLYEMASPYVLRVESKDNVCYSVDTAHVSVYPYADPRFSGSLVRNTGDVDFMRVPIGTEQNIQLVYGNPSAVGSVSIPIWDPLSADWLTIDASDPTKATIKGTSTGELSLRAIVYYQIDNTTKCEEHANLKLLPMSRINPPNAFTPNGDGFNDTWRVLFDEEILEYPSLEVQIFNRWGSLVYQAKPYKNDWNGKHNGIELPTGTYYYVIKPHRGNLPNITGSVSIIR